jgi:DNA-binding NarL/FixJ family response regulator
MSRPRIVLADDHRVFAEGLKSLLDAEFDVVGIAEDGQALLDIVDDLAPDLVVTDISMPKLNGIECVRRLRESNPEMKIVLLTMHEDVGLATTAIRAGASGYLLKHDRSEDVLRAIREALQGGVHVSPPMAEGVMRALASGKEDKPELTQRQTEILCLLVEGLSAKEIAARLHLSPRTVEFHKYQTMERVGVSTSAELIAYAVKRGIGPI